MSTRETQAAKVLRHWIRKQAIEPGRYFFGHQFMSIENEFVGYKAPTRFVELCNDYSHLFVDTKMEGKYRVGRIRLSDLAAHARTLPKTLRPAALEELDRLNIKPVATVPSRSTDQHHDIYEKGGELRCTCNAYKYRKTCHHVETAKEQGVGTGKLL